MEHFKQFISEVVCIKIKSTNGFLDLSDYDFMVHESRINELKELALVDAPLLNPQQLAQQLINLENIKERLSKANELIQKWVMGVDKNGKLFYAGW